MNSFELNKVLGAVLGTCLILLALNIGAGALFAEHKPAKPGYMIAVKAEHEGGKTEAKVEKPIAVLLASANVEKGQSTAKQCQSCHTFEKGGPNRVGPNLYGVVNEPKGQGHAGFNFSAAMKGKGGTWTFDDLNKFLTSPKAFVPGTAMGFAGLPKDSERADVIAYLNSLSDHPAPVPTAAK